MKKIKSIIILTICLFLTSSCNALKSEGIDILTTIYPINYVVEQLYSSGNIESIYPDGADVTSYNLTNKQIKEHSKNDIFIYNGLSNELNIAKNLINTNSKLKIIDIAYGLKYSNGVEELWLSPNYFLMITTTIKDKLIEYSKSKYTNEEINKNFKKLEETISIMDAELRNIAKSAKDINKNTLVVSSDMFKYLESYGFNIISLENTDSVSSISANNIKSNFKNGTYHTIFIKNNEEKSELISLLEKDYNAKIVKINTMTTLTSEEKNNQENYLTIMNNYLEQIKDATIGE